MPALTESGGVAAAARFLCEIIEGCKWLDCRLFSIPTSARDPASVRLTAPTTWLRGPVVEGGRWLGREFEHIGSVMSELEFQRYRPRSILTRRLQECDLVQVVAGSPAWALVTLNVDLPVALQVATLVAAERRQRLCSEEGMVTAWRRLMTRITARMDRKGARIADRVFVLNSWMKREIEGWTEPGRVRLAPPGVDTELYCPPSRSSVSERGAILSVGRFDDRRKNVRLLFEAYGELCRRQNEVPPLVLIGKSGPRDEDWSMAQKLGIRQRVRFHEDVPRRELAAYYQEASVFVLSSSEEGLGIVLLEAMASGLPVVSTATHGATEAVEHGKTGILTPVGDATALCEAMERLLANPALAHKMGQNGRQRAEQHYSTRAAGRRILAAYKELLSHGEVPKGAA